MTDSYTVDIGNTEWTDISQSNLMGYITNNGNDRVHLLQADTKPDPSVEAEDGHPLEAATGINFSLIQNETVWSRAIQPTARLIITPGI